MRASNWTHSFFRQGSKPKKWLMESKPTTTWRHHFGVKINCCRQNNSRAHHHVKNQYAKAIGPKAGSNSRIQFASNESKLVPRKLDPGHHLKWALDFTLTVSLLLNTQKCQTGPIWAALQWKFALSWHFFGVRVDNVTCHKIQKCTEKQTELWGLPWCWLGVNKLSIQILCNEYTKLTLEFAGLMNTQPLRWNKSPKVGLIRATLFCWDILRSSLAS
jgi:hypothetical protein